MRIDWAKVNDFQCTDHTIWNIRIAIDYMIRIILSITSGVMYIVTITLINYGWNKQFYNLNTDVMRSIQFTFAALAAEIIVFVVVIIFTHYIWNLFNICILSHLL